MPNVFALFLCVTSLDTNIWDDVVLSRWNAIVAHDSATGYFQGSSIVNISEIRKDAGNQLGWSAGMRGTSI